MLERLHQDCTRSQGSVGTILEVATTPWPWQRVLSPTASCLCLLERSPALICFLYHALFFFFKCAINSNNNNNKITITINKDATFSLKDDDNKAEQNKGSFLILHSCSHDPNNDGFQWLISSFLCLLSSMGGQREHQRLTQRRESSSSESPLLNHEGKDYPSWDTYWATRVSQVLE